MDKKYRCVTCQLIPFSYTKVCGDEFTRIACELCDKDTGWLLTSEAAIATWEKLNERR